MRDVIFIGRKGCSSCYYALETIVKPLMEKQPDHISYHYEWDAVIERVNRRAEIKEIPLYVIENHGEEEFRVHGMLTYDDVKAIIECEMEVLTLDDVLNGL